MNSAQAEAFLRGFHNELEKNAALFQGLKGVAKLWGRAATGKSGGKALQLSTGKTLGRGALARQAWQGTKGFVKKNPAGSAALGAGALGAGYAATR